MKLLTTLLFTSIILSCSKTNTDVIHTLQVSLESPVANGTLKRGQNAEFKWTSNATDVSVPVYYGIKIVEIITPQSPAEAIRGNKPHFEKDSLKPLSFVIVPSAGAPGFAVDKKYAWEVTGKQKNLSANSSIFSFTIVP